MTILGKVMRQHENCIKYQSNKVSNETAMKTLHRNFNILLRLEMVKSWTGGWTFFISKKRILLFYIDLWQGLKMPTQVNPTRGLSPPKRGFRDWSLVRQKECRGRRFFWRCLFSVSEQGDKWKIMGKLMTL
jgi:hypothetical protein